MTPLPIRGASPDDLGPILDLLVRADLPIDGLADHLSDALVACDGARVVGIVALERYADGALLRSVAVDPAVRGTGLGRRLVDAAIARAREQDVPALFLLTTTAEGYFPRFGFERVARADVPASVQASVEFTSACPASAVVMRKPLG